MGFNDFILLTGRSNPKLAKFIGKILKKEVFEPVTIFSDGEIRVKIAHNLRRRHVFVIQSTCTPVNDNLMELIFMIDAAKRASASEIIAVLPYCGYSRQDRKEMPRVPISSSVVARLIENAGADTIVTVDIHSEQQQGFITGPWDNLYASYSLIPVIKSKRLKHLVVASPDKGGVKRATGYARLLNAEGIAIVYKERDMAVNNKSEALEIIGNVNGKDVLLVDDMLDTATTLVNAANLIKKRGARRILASTTHGLFTGGALEKISQSAIDEVLITDTIPSKPGVLQNKKITVISVANLLAEAIRRIQTGESMSKDLIL
ncbi:MAG: hypothetical protein A3F31_03325 [Candidatus Levybacteria bacterium RIFCSPHIGHO2_12_FULL_38_12]|nr:MAG: hypothetical protein A2770_03750 [Candidatus Levybacteria bacterium RIFCSPHIGHO2_01_FULL_38_12]OGH22131.1 MAG: hypothetical protein A3D75_02695 [Candidatus Levybacteria bacterium RIFCSPHIGHO2_02_FULL_37_18]OGH22978.1 MAG: hypothetical protein A3F31_03325 [Candidatus Levybacteria bacterium RIFCSPHIGHO2_12_FULL_38_12]OGH34149.1 MAG: hypothetical protein A3A47_03455 [Candidatus Levybacteria bacterium RIFCSPLOWO2_01_FULL_37_20]OGH44942.1 MAG: hypothetical protein A3J14_01120 [Candidatus Lev